VADDERWVWDPRLGRYRNLKTGRLLPAARIRQMRDQLIAAITATITGLVQRLASGDWTVGTWERAMRQAIKSAFGAQYVFGRGGLRAMEPADWQHLGELVQQQYGYLEQFATDVANGGLSQPQITVRATMYVGSSVQAHEAGKAAALFVELPAMPGDGSSECMSNDRCSWHLRRRADGNVEATWVAEDDPKTCATCRQRARDWNPLVLVPGEPSPPSGLPGTTRLRMPSRTIMPVSS
jgi:hypothetical protein